MIVTVTVLCFFKHNKIIFCVLLSFLRLIFKIPAQAVYDHYQLIGTIVSNESF